MSHRLTILWFLRIDSLKLSLLDFMNEEEKELLQNLMTKIREELKGKDNTIKFKLQ